MENCMAEGKEHAIILSMLFINVCVHERECTWYTFCGSVSFGNLDGN